MKMKMNLIVLIGVLATLNYPADSSLLDPVIENVRHIKATHPPGTVEGVWKKKMLWKPRWIKEWKSSNVLKPIWKKFWGPVIIREWVPIPKPPPQWDAQTATLDSKPAAPGSPFVDSPKTPLSGFSFLQSSIFPSTSVNDHQPKQKFPSYSPPVSPLKPVNYQGPPLPITSGFNSQAESYSGHSSYASNVDSSAFDLNPPVEQYNPQQPDYGYKEQSVSIAHNSYSALQKPAVFPSHPHPHPYPDLHSHPHHHHYHHHHQHQHEHPQFGKPVPHIDHTHNSDQTKFPPDWNVWNPVPQNPHIHSQAQQGSSPVSVISAVKSTLPDSGKQNIVQESPSIIQTGDDDFIQQAPLLSEYHYTETAPQNHTLGTFSLSSPTPVTQHSPLSNSLPAPTSVPKSNPPPLLHHKAQPPIWHQPTPTPTYHKPPPNPQQKPPQIHHPKDGNPQNRSLHFHPRNPPTISHKPHFPKPSTQNFSSSKVVNSVYYPSPKPNFPKENKVHVNKTVKPVQSQLSKVPDFKSLPSTVEAFHFIEPFPSNQTLTRAALVGNVNQTESNRISIISPKKITPDIAKLAEEIVQQHLKSTQKENVSPQSTTMEPTTLPTQETRVTVVYPTTSNAIKKTLKAYLAEESEISNKTTNVFIVTPVPLKTGEI